MGLHSLESEASENVQEQRRGAPHVVGDLPEMDKAQPDRERSVDFRRADLTIHTQSRHRENAGGQGGKKSRKGPSGHG